MFSQANSFQGDALGGDFSGIAGFGLCDAFTGLAFGQGELWLLPGISAIGGLWNESSEFAAPLWVLSAGGVSAVLDIDFVNNQAWSTPRATIPSLLTCTRASTGYYTNSNGTLTSFGNNVLRYGNQGLLVEESRTNVVLWCRDMTNAAWTKTNCTAALDQTGNDGTVNGASSLLATAGNATCLQAITLGSTARFQSVWAKRLIGSGTVNMTMDNGATWTAITLTSSWQQLTIPTQTLANPTVGFQIVTNGDKIAVDFVQNENGTFATSPILTTTTSATRAKDQVYMSTSSIGGFGGTVGALYAKFVANGYGTNRYPLNLNDNGGSNYTAIVHSAGNAGAALVENSGIVYNNSDFVSRTSGTLAIALSFAPNNYQAAVQGAAIAGQLSGGAAVNPTTLCLNGLTTSDAFDSSNTYIRRIAYWGVALSSAQLAALPT